MQWRARCEELQRRYTMELTRAVHDNTGDENVRMFHYFAVLGLQFIC